MHIYEVYQSILVVGGSGARYRWQKEHGFCLSNVVNSHHLYLSNTFGDGCGFRYT